jgi:hypothetical protein
VTAGGWIYVADTLNHVIRRIVRTGSDPLVPASYTVSTVAGLAGASGSTDGTGSTARFYVPRQLAADIDGRVYVGDSGNGSVRVLTVAGADTVTASTLATGLSLPTGVALDTAHNVYVAEHNGNKITRVSPVGGKVVIMGTGSAGFTDGRDGTMNGPRSVQVDYTGSLLLTDMYNHAVRSIQRIIEATAP